MRSHRTPGERNPFTPDLPEIWSDDATGPKASPRKGPFGPGYSLAMEQSPWIRCRLGRAEPLALEWEGWR
jgi:hypothetical protein